MAAPLRLVSRLALVTGGGSGIGHAVCQKLAREGAAVAVVDVIEAAAHETMRTLPCDHPEQQHEAFCADISSSEGVKQLLEGVQMKYSRPACIVVNCAGIIMDEFLLKMEEEDFDRVLAVNLKGTFLITRGFSNALIASGAKKGSIINLGSIVGKVGNLGQANYAASKAGVEGLTKTAAKELARFGIRCNTVAPGFIATPMTDKVPKKVLEKIEKVIPLGRLGDPEDVAEACAFLASDDSSYITGTSLEITGGLFL
ncbi:estradiol 17-beta-dehydrogenase 8 [Latimeria chalumnae]|uniref:estradiol 17-beta-dehydrogenase 8 n=1 Tax=Latimeria chalumnae TaxID=7897 RepID=UPI0006D93E47|nr:PREDICTED: estradiol 17-beta-dehydrogenase 8 [Latimeria chalumnae]|eukprot:XP_014346905.1 PREDICTED: estradiol 17-beta-dehydrogenase 8 [Latimeria chalumnae]